MGGAGSGAVNQFYNVSNAPVATGGGFAWVLQKGNPDLTSGNGGHLDLGPRRELGQQHDVVVRLVQGRDRRRDHAVLGDLRGLPLLRRDDRDHGRGGSRSRPQRRPVNWFRRDLNNGDRVERSAVLRQPGHDQDVGHGHRVELAQAVGDGNLELQSAGDDPRLLQDQAVACAVRRRNRLGGLAGPGREPLGHQRRRVRLSAVRLGQLLAERLERGPAVAVSAVRVYRRSMRPSRRSRRTTRAWLPVERASCSATRRRRSIESNDYNIFDLSFGWNINDTLSFRGGITNLFDTEPEVVGASTGYPMAPTCRASAPVSGAAPRRRAAKNPLAYSLTGAAGGVPAAGSYQSWLLRHVRPSLLRRLEHSVLVRRFFNLSRRAPRPAVFFWRRVS